MPLPNPIVKVVFSGSLYADTEIWSCSLSMINVGQAEGPMDPATDPHVAALSAWFRRPTSNIAAGATLESVKVNLIDVNGLYASTAVTREVLLDPIVTGGGRGNPPPSQITSCVSLLSAFARGPGSKGRFYPPLSLGSLGQDGRMSPGTALEMATSATQLIDDLNAIDPQGGVVIASALGSGSAFKVARVRVGRVPDTQQRRRNAMDEDYQTVAVGA